MGRFAHNDWSHGSLTSSDALLMSPDRKYTVISSPEQRQRYKNDFNAEYSEYRGLHARIERITRHFSVLDNELKQLQQGTDKYKVNTRQADAYFDCCGLGSLTFCLLRRSIIRSLKSIIK